MKKLRLLILILSLLWLFCIVVTVSTPESIFADNHEFLKQSFQSPLSPQSNEPDHAFYFEAAKGRITETPAYPPVTGQHLIINGVDITLPYSELSPSMYTIRVVERLNIKPDLDIDITDIPDGSKINDRGETIKLSHPERTPAAMIRCLSAEVFLFPPEASQLRI